MATDCRQMMYWNDYKRKKRNKIEAKLEQLKIQNWKKKLSSLEKLKISVKCVQVQSPMNGKDTDIFGEKKNL